MNALSLFSGIGGLDTVNGNYNKTGASKNSGDGLAATAGGSLNPDWVEWLMGFPVGWTDIGM
jgi:hypothetical protein